jgi:hypothetical protein
MWKILTALILASLFLAGCGGNVTPTLVPITPIVEIDTLLATPRPLLDPATLSKDTRGCLIPLDDYTQLNSVENGYCLVYPGYFQEAAGDTDPSMVTIKGPDRFADPVPVQVTLSIQAVPAGEKTLEEAVGEVLTANAEAEIFRTPVTLDEHPAEILENLPGPFSTRVAVAVVNGMQYTISLTPADEDSPSTQYDSSDIWATLVSTLHFFPPEAAGAPARGTDTSVWAEQELTGLGMGFLIPQEWEMTSTLDSFILAPRKNYTPNWIGIRVIPDLPVDDVAQLSDAIETRFEEQSITFGEIRSRIFNGLDAVEVSGRPDVCLNLYVPAYGLVHEISLHPDLCNENGEVINEEAITILDSMRFFQAIE